MDLDERALWNSRAARENGADVLVRMAKEYEAAVDLAVSTFLLRALPPGRDLVLRLNDDYAVDLSMSYRAPTMALSKTIERCSSIRRRAYAQAS